MSKIKIDTDALKSLDLTIAEFALLMFYQQEQDLDEAKNKLIEKGFISKNLNPEKDIDFWVTKEGIDFINTALCNSIKTTEKHRELAVSLMNLFPEGRKPGTVLPWRGNETDIINKIKAFKTKYKYSNEQILNATKLYTENYLNDNTYMKVLKYFILKNNESTLADIIENGLPSDNTSYENFRINA